MEQTYLNFHKQILSKSFEKFKKHFILIVLTDMIFYALLINSASKIIKRVLIKYNALDIPSMDQIAIQGLGKAQEVLQLTRGFFFLVVFSTLFFLLISIALITVFKGFIWSRVSQKKLTIRLLRKFLILNLIWVTSWALLLFSSALVFESLGMLVIVLMAIILSFVTTANAYSMFFINEKIFSSFKGFALYFSKIKHFCFSTLTFGILMVIITILSNFIKFKYDSILFSVLFALAICFNRFQVFEITKSIVEKSK